MASSNTGLHAALIIFVILTVVLLATTVLFFRSMEEQTEVAAQVQAELSGLRGTNGQLQDELNLYKTMMGVSAEDDQTQVTTAYNDTLAKFAQAYGVAADSDEYKALNYRRLLELQQTRISDRNAALIAVNEEKEKLRTALEQEVANARTQATGLAGEVAKVNEDKQGVITQFSDLENTVQKDKETLRKENEARYAKYNEAEQKYVAEVANLEAQKGQADSKIVELQEVIKEREPKPEFEVADGEIVRVDPGNRTVWINLGSADKLQRQVPFSVHAQGNHRIDYPKARIEVSKILLDHLAECRILEDSVENPIVRGDMVYSPVWKKGREIHVALAGWMDIDQDGISDRQFIRSAILKSGGIIDAEVTDQGDRTGDPTIRTRYLVLGEQPIVSERDAAGLGKKVTNAYNKLINDSEKVNIEVMSVERFLDLVGVDVPARVGRYDETGGKEAFVDPIRDGGRPVSQRYLDESFKNRRPPTQPTISADGGEPDTVKPAVPRSPVRRSSAY